MMGPGDIGSDPWDEFLARYFGRGEGGRRPPHRVDITRLMTADAREMLADAARRAAQRQSSDLDTDHLLWAALQRESLRDLVRRAGADPDTLLNALGGKGDGAPRGEVPPNLSLTPAAKRALLDAHQLSRAMGANYIGPEHILMALPLNPESPAGRMLAAGRIQPESLQAANAERGPMTGPKPDRGTPTLDQYGQDLTDLARNDQIDPVVGRADEIEQAIEILSRRTKNNPVLIGEAGVGKTAIVEGLAERICDGDVPQTLLGKRVVQLDLAGLVAGTRYRGDFEERLKKVIDEIRAHRDELIIFMDEIHTLVGAGGAGSEGGMDASNMLKPALARGELRVIGATTLDEYRKSIEKDAALARRFQPVLVPEPSVDDTIAILRGLRDRYEAHHQVRFTDEALVAAAELSDRYVTDRFLPDKAIDLIDQAGARVRLRTRTPASDVRELEQELDEVRRDKEQAVTDEQYERASALRDRIAELEEDIRRANGEDGSSGSQVPEVGPQEIAEVVSRATGIPVSQLTEEERDRLLRLEGHLHQKVVGQDDAVTAVAEAVRRSRAGLADPERPMGSFLFLGPTGVGKTELARALAEALFGEADRMVRVDMSEFQERHTVSRLVGAPPGYVGYEEAGQLTEAVRRRPYAVVLLDEIEKAHPDVFNILLQVLDDGRLTDSQGRTVNFKNTVLIMTSNLGSELITGAQRSVGFGTGDVGSEQESNELRERLMRRLQENFRPEFLNRIDEVIIFRRLEAEQLRDITALLLEETRRRMHAQDLQVEFTTAGIDWLAEHGYQPEFGARPLRRVIQREVDNHLSRMLLESAISPGQKVTVDVRDGALTFDVTAGERGYTAATTTHPR
ncbi:ATP-dependent Clp protease ATP-binding subunit [Micromonospora saelicesensis]|uniref:ATP-dependent Clp protease ATP-binding subunit C lpA like protein n=1 Tax=Micromonospora saelicesensis TaxID=285676 RepID=A0A1C5A9T1_9ACTN|nr:ATP-dependent Clp protease ATP-binding subunit [Micromonospora saelicesensis]RAN95839.1 ATP-dependent Clp protease ATP-binding subunit C lpA like protein [Micromonospora saelicesensis]RAO34446.1 ATP-dependent Clp protease ATP-binding subunit C lpA like protein [Micromonospora saelicesensis]RAO42895.1 ATP-dependent Clp protease ATP-binding subunit C lpA like protein [Micromonospora saelicesensis]RAO51341.1 ATP-dependent Clp protease ATP-binding subunit C lpA like protein [Micromonospora saeli